ncbi:MAG: hypothetical protein WBK28_02845, partial [Minisyncoccia bacterium]
MNLLFVHRSVALIATLVLIFTSLGMPGSASAVNVPEPDTCNEEYTYTFSSKDFGDYGDDSSKPANIDYINTGDAGEPDRVSVSADAGFSITKVELSVDDDGNPGFVTVATGPITNHNPAGTEINVAKITVKKECPDACSNIAGIQATVPAGYETVTPGICTVIPQCRDGVDNTDAEDTLADASDPGCWSDPNNPNTYNGNDTDETSPTDVCPLVVGIQTSIESCPAETKATVHTAKVICDSEADLPNYGNNGPNITASTAQDWVTQSDGACELASNWNFQWAPSTATNPGDNVTSAGNPWTTFTGLVELLNPAGGTFWLRESIPANQGWVPFSGDITLPYNEYSAEFYCDTDVLHYDNFDFIAGVTAGEDYYCVAWNAKAPQCSDGLDNDGDEAVDYPSDLGCTSAQDNDETDIPPPPPLPQCSDGIDNVDSEDTLADASDPGCLSGPDNSYNPSDNDETDIPPPPPLPQCSDGIDNDGDEAIDYVVEGGDPGCSSPEDNDESDEPDSCEAGFHEEVVQEEAQTPFAPTICGEGFTLSGTQCVASAAPVCEGGTYNTDTNVCDIPGFPEEEIPPSTEPAACLAEGAVLNPDSDQCEVVG